MSRITGRLTDPKIDALAGELTAYKVSDRDGLYLLVTPAGAKYWRWDYRFAGARKTLSLGVWPAVKLEPARERLGELRKLLASGADPSAARAAAKSSLEQAARDTFKALAGEWLETWREGKAPSTVIKAERHLETYLYPKLGRRPIASIEPPDLLKALRPIEDAGKLETAHSVKGVAAMVFQFAIACGKCTRNPAPDLRGALKPVKATPHAALTAPMDIARLLRAIDGFKASLPVESALKLAPYVFVRPGELRTAEWAEIDWLGGLWRIPAEKIKTRVDLLVPLATQVVALFREIQKHTGGSRYVFPSMKSDRHPMSDMSINAGLRRLGFRQDQMTAHGFRTIASTTLNELGWDREWVERQLNHVEKDPVRAIYNRALYLEPRRAMMQTWADFLDALRAAPPDLAGVDFERFRYATPALGPRPRHGLHVVASA